jgi:hypothetical protein
MTTMFRAWVILCLVASFLLAPHFTYAQGSDPATARLAETSITIPANGEAELSFQGYCLDFGEPFPTSFGAPGSRASDDVLKVVKTALLDGTADEDPLTVNLAIWTLREDKTIEVLYPAMEEAKADKVNELLERSEKATVEPLATDRGIALDKAIADGQVEVTSADFTADEAAPLAVPEDEGHPYHGSGTMTIKNLTNAEITIYYAFGTVLQAEDDSEQDLVTYSTELERQPLMPQTGLAPMSATTAPMMVLVGLGLMGVSLVGYRAWQTRQ